MDTRQSLSPFAAEVFLAIGGVVTSAVIAFVLFLVATYARFDFSSFMYWFVIPVGAILSGMAASSGHYLVSLAIDHPPTHSLAVNMVLIGLTTYMLIKFLSYLALTFEDGTPVSGVVPFRTYYQVAAETTSLRIGRTGSITTGELGQLGYVYEVIRLAGFLAGGFALWTILRNKPFCPDCQRYYLKEPLLKRASIHELQRFLDTCGLTFPNVVEAYQEAVQKHPPDTYDVQLYYCPTCDQKQFHFGFCGPQKIYPHAKSVVANQHWTITHAPATIVGDNTVRFREASRRWRHSHTGSAI